MAEGKGKTKYDKTQDKTFVKTGPKSRQAQDKRQKTIRKTRQDKKQKTKDL